MYIVQVIFARIEALSIANVRIRKTEALNLGFSDKEFPKMNTKKIHLWIYYSIAR